MKEIQIGITDDDSLITSLLKSFLEAVPGFLVTITASGGKELLSKLSEADVIPDILLLDLKMAEMDGIEVTRCLRTDYPSIKIIVISSHYQRSFMGFMLKTGASAFVPKGISTTLLTEIIKTTYEKGFYFMEEQMEVIRGQISSGAPAPILDGPNVLSDREVEIIRLISFQKTAKEIADVLFLSPRTVEGHKNNLFIKTGAKNIAGLVIYAIQHHIISVEELPKI